MIMIWYSIWLVIDIGVFDTYYASVVNGYTYCERELKYTTVNELLYHFVFEFKVYCCF